MSRPGGAVRQCQSWHTAYMAHAVEFFLDDEADATIRGLWQQLERVGVPSLAHHARTQHRPHVTFAVAAAISPRLRNTLNGDLALLSLPALWLSTLGTFANPDNVLFLGAVVDTELLAVHSAVHDALAGKARDQSAYYLPGAWIPHCTLAQEITTAQLATGFAELHPVSPIRAKISEIGITDTRTGETELLSSR